MGTDKFKRQINKNKALKTSTDEVTESLYEAQEKEEIPYEEPKAAQIMPEPVNEAAPVKKSPGRPKGEDTVRKTLYIPDELWYYVQAAVKLNGGNLQTYFNDLIKTDIGRNLEKYKELAELYRSIDSKQ